LTSKRECFLEILIDHGIRLLRSIGSGDHDIEGHTVFTEPTLGEYRFHRAVGYGTHENLNLFARLDTRDP
jgi:hypothetical protein